VKEVYKSATSQYTFPSVPQTELDIEMIYQTNKHIKEAVCHHIYGSVLL
jgi:hypothetical protein